MAFDNALFQALIYGGTPHKLAKRAAESTVTQSTREKNKTLVYSGMDPRTAGELVGGTIPAARKDKVLARSFHSSGKGVVSSKVKTSSLIG